MEEDFSDLAGLDQKSDAFSWRLKLMGTIADGESKDFLYTKSPRFRGVEFTGTKGDPVEIWVRGSRGDDVTWLLDGRFNVIAKNDDADDSTMNSHIVATLPDSEDDRYYIVMRDYYLENRRFTVELEHDRGTVEYDLASDWSNVVNPFGGWELRSGDVTIPGIIANWDGIVGQSAWAKAQAPVGYTPSFFRVAVADPAFADLKIGDVALHSQDEGSGAGNGRARIVWTSPSDGRVDLAGNTWLGRNIGRSNDWTLTVAGVEVASGSISDGDAYDRAHPFDFADGATRPLTDRPVVAGDEVVLEVVQAPASPYGEFTGVNLTISLSR